jgi:hypothetical protein
MPHGAGRYSAECTAVRKKLNAGCVILLVMDGPLGSGFSIESAKPLTPAQLAALLRDMAAQIERDG